MKEQENISIGNFIESISEQNNYKEIPFPLKRQMPFKDGTLTLTIDYGELGKQMECYYFNELNDFYKQQLFHSQKQT